MHIKSFRLSWIYEYAGKYVFNDNCSSDTFILYGSNMFFFHAFYDLHLPGPEESVKNRGRALRFLTFPEGQGKC